MLTKTLKTWPLLCPVSVHPNTQACPLSIDPECSSFPECKVFSSTSVLQQSISTTWGIYFWVLSMEWTLIHPVRLSLGISCLPEKTFSNPRFTGFIHLPGLHRTCRHTSVSALVWPVGIFIPNFRLELEVGASVLVCDEVIF